MVNSSPPVVNGGNATSWGILYDKNVSLTVRAVGVQMRNNRLALFGALVPSIFMRS